MNINTSILSSNQHLLQQMQKIHTRLEDLRLRLNEPIVPLTNEAILHLSSELQPLYKALIMYNLDEFITRNLETALWNDCFKTPLTRYGRTDKNLFNLMIESGVGFYLGLIQDIGVHFDISFITNTPSSTKLYCTSTMMNNNFIKPSKSSIYFIIQSCLLHVGDLLRYRGSSYPEAMKMYEKSAAVCPSNGYPYHQMGLTQLLISTTTGDSEILMDGLLSCLYYFARSLAVSNRYLPAFQSIESLVKSKIEPMTKLAKPQEMLRQFMVSIQNNTKSGSLFQLMHPVVANQQVNASTLVKMIVIALWNNWKNQFSPNSLEIIACIFNSVLGAVVATLGDQQQFAYCLPHLKLLVEWMNWYQDNPTMEALFSKLNSSALVSILNQLRANNQFAINVPDSWVLEAILPEEKKLIGFIPLDYSVCFNAGSSAGPIGPPNSNNSSNGNSSRQAILGGHLLSEDKDVALSFNLRIYRIVSVALKMAANKNCFMYDGIKFVEKTNSPTSSTVPTPVQPSRRNVALQSIFRTANTNIGVGEQAALDNQNYHADLPSPSTCAASYMTAGGGMGSSNLTPNNVSNTLPPLVPSSATPSLSASGLTTTHDFFRSIWTPDNENTESNWN